MEKEILKDIRKELGDSVKELAKPNIISIFPAIFLGIMLGSIPIFIPGVPASAKLDLTGRSLLIAIPLGHKGSIDNLSFYMPPGAMFLQKKIGVVLFLSCVGLLSGGKFMETIINGGLQWMLYGIIITLLPVILVGFIGRIFKINYLTMCGCIAGSMTSPPALEFANGIHPSRHNRPLMLPFTP